MAHVTRSLIYIKNKSILLFLPLLLSGCANQAMPNFINGRYYMLGDSSCTRYRTLSDDAVMCLNNKGEETGYRTAMTDQQLMMYQANQQMQAQQMQNINSQIQQNNANIYQNNQRMLQGLSNYQAPQVQSPYYNQNNSVKCISTGFYTNCRY